MFIYEFIEQFNMRYPSIDKTEHASEEMICAYEKTLGYPLPPSFRLFLKHFSNVISCWIANLLVVLTITLLAQTFVMFTTLFQIFQVKYS
ncbi:SMI1/KNR4 family protein [Sporosarcina saromensis]|uniref:SMI1/KNR4 family protein n=1 Tax=Sporosarcina saromensis TaxID=359365 RepID=UPI0037D9ED6C